VPYFHFKDGWVFIHTLTAPSPEAALDESKQMVIDRGWTPDTSDAEVSPAAQGQFHVRFRIERIDHD
jgi:hypothetical protein